MPARPPAASRGATNRKRRPADGSPSAAGAGGGDDSDEDMGYEASMYDESNYIALPTKSEAVNALAPSGTMTGKGTAMAKQVMPNQGRLHVLRVQVWTTFDDPSSSRTAKALSTLVLVVIFTSIINFAIGTSPDVCEYQPGYSGDDSRVCMKERIEEKVSTQNIETVCILIFSVEYIIRLACVGAVKPVREFLLDPLNMLDLVAILPWYVMTISKAVSGGGGGSIQKLLGVVRIVRLTRILRVFKASKMMIVLGKTMQRSSPVMAILLVSVTGMMLLFGAILLAIERGEYNKHTRQYTLPDGGGTPFDSIGTAMYWCMATMTTVGYGDLYPVTPPGQIVGMVAALLGIVILSLPITVIGATFSEEYEEQNRIAERERRLKAMHNWQQGQMKAKRPAKAALTIRRFQSSSLPGAENPSGASAEGATSTRQSEASPPKLDGSGSPTGTSPPSIRGPPAAKEGGEGRRSPPPMNSIPIPGYLQCEWLLSDFRNATANELKAALLKSESDLLRMSRKAIVQSRLLTRPKADYTTHDAVLAAAASADHPAPTISATDRGSPLARGAPSAQRREPTIDE